MRKITLSVSITLLSLALLFVGIVLISPESIQNLKGKILPSEPKSGTAIFDDSFDFGSSNTVDNQRPSAEVKGISTTKEVTPTQKQQYYQPQPTPTQPSSGIPEGGWNDAIPAIDTTTQQSSNNSKLQVIADIFKKIGKLNSQIDAYSILQSETAKSYACDINTWRQEYLPNGEKNPSYVFDPHVQNKLYEDCLNSLEGILNTISSDSDSVKNQIRDLNNQAYDITKSCTNNECFDYYWQLVTGFEANGFFVR